MIKVQYVEPNQVYQIWHLVEPFLKDSADVGLGHYSVEHTKLYLTTGAKQLLIGVDEENNIVGGMVVEFINYPNERVMFITDLGGRSVVEDSVFSQVEEWARQNGATRACAWADAARARLYKQKSGFTTVMHVVEKKL